MESPPPTYVPAHTEEPESGRLALWPRLHPLQPISRTAQRGQSFVVGGLAPSAESVLDFTLCENAESAAFGRSARVPQALVQGP